MKTGFKKFLEATMTMQSSGINIIPPIDDDGGDFYRDYGPGDWDEWLSKSTKEWMKKKDSCYRELLEALLGSLFNKDNNYDYDRLYLTTYINSITRYTAVGKVEFEWNIKHDITNPKFINLKKKVQSIMQNCSSFWQHTRLRNGNEVINNNYFFNKFFQILWYSAEKSAISEAKVSAAHLLKTRMIKYRPYHALVEDIILGEVKKKFAAEGINNINFKITKKSMYGFFSVYSFHSLVANALIEYDISGE